MTEENTGRALPVRDRSGTAETLAKALTEEERANGLRCWVRHEAAGGKCPRTATTMVYGLLFCEIHGAEVMAGALAELYQDAGDFLERLDNPHVPAPNAEAERVLRGLLAELDRRRSEYESEEAEDAALRRAYPYDAERVCDETVAFDYHYGPGNEFGAGDMPEESYRDARRLLCKEMRIAYEGRADWLVETLELERESASAQLAFALEDYERKMGTPEERERMREESRARRDPIAEVLASTNSALTTASDRLEEVPPEAFEGEEDYWTAKRAIAQAGGLVVAEYDRRRERSAGDRPAE